MQQPGGRKPHQTQPLLDRQGKRLGASRNQRTWLPNRPDHPLSRKSYRRLAGRPGAVQQRGASGRQLYGLYTLSRAPRCWRV